MVLAEGPIIVGVDGSEGSEEALSWAADLARLTGGQLELVWAWEIPTSYGWPVPLPEDCDFEGDARNALSETVSRVLGDDPGLAHKEHLVQGHPADVLTRLSERAGLLVVGSRGRGTFRAALLGSVSAYLATHARCPLVIFRPHHRSATEHDASS